MDLDHVFPVDADRQADRDLPAAGLHLQHLLESGIDIAVEGHPLAQVRDVLAADLQALADVAAEAGDPVGRGDGEAVAVEQPEVAAERLDRELHAPPGRAADAAHRPHGLAHRLGRIHRGPFPTLPVQVELCIAAVEGLGGVGREAPAHLAPRGAAVAVRVLRHQRVQRQGIVPHHVLDVGGVLEPALDLEGGDPGIGQVLQPRLEVEVLERQEGLVAEQHAAVAVREVVERPAGLDALAAVRAAPVDILRQAAVAAVAHAERAVHEELDLALHGSADLPDGLQGELALQDDARTAEGFEVPGARHVPDGALGRRVQRNGDIVPCGDPRLPDDERIGARLLRAQQLRVRLLLLAVAPQRVECHEDADTETVRVRTEFRNVLKGVAGRLAGAEFRPCDIYGIGTAVDGCDADILRPGRSQQLERLHYFRASSIFLASAP